MKKITTSNYRMDPHYPRIVRAVTEILARADVVAPVEVFVHMELLQREQLNHWRLGRAPYLEQVIRCNLAKASRILRILRMHAHDLHLRPSHTASVRFGKGPRVRLRFSKTGVRATEKVRDTHRSGVLSEEIFAAALTPTTGMPVEHP